MVTFLWPSILTPLFWHFETGNNKSGRDSVVGDSVSPALLWLCRPQSDQTRYFVMPTWLLSFFMEWDSILATSCTLCFQKVCAFYYKSNFMLLRQYDIYGTATSHVVGRKQAFYVANSLGYSWQFYQCQLITNIETILYQQFGGIHCFHFHCTISQF